MTPDHYDRMFSSKPRIVIGREPADTVWREFDRDMALAVSGNHEDAICTRYKRALLARLLEEEAWKA